MLRTLLVFGVLVGALVALRDSSRSTGPVVRRVDDELTAQVAVARAAGLAALAPVGLPATWAPTSARFSTSDYTVGGRALLHAGFVTPSQAFAALEETDGDVAGALAAVEGAGVRAAGSVVVGDVTWQVGRARQGTTTLTRRTTAGVHVGVSGGASQAELEQLVAALR